MSLTFKENTIWNIFSIYTIIVEIPTNKGEHSWKCSELSLKRKEQIATYPLKVIPISEFAIKHAKLRCKPGLYNQTRILHLIAHYINSQSFVMFHENCITCIWSASSSNLTTLAGPFTLPLLTGMPGKSKAHYQILAKLWTRFNSTLFSWPNRPLSQLI